MSLNLFIIGPSGCGKSTQAQLLAQKYQLIHFSMGQLLRDQVALGEHIGLDAKSFIDQGKPVPDDIVLPILTEKINSLNNQNFIIDGFPRVLEQGIYIDKYLNNKNKPFSLLIHLLVDFEEIIHRRQAKGVDFQDQTRTDNTPQAVANRQKILYEANIAPIINYYKKQDKLFEVDGNRPIDPIFNDICLAIDRLIKT